MSRPKPDLPPEEPFVSPNNKTSDLDSRVASIAGRFPAYRNDGIEPLHLTSQELKCKNCTFKFRSQYVATLINDTELILRREERDKHHLSRYCAGNRVVCYDLYIDHSKPGGYRIERVTIPFDGKSEDALFACDKCSSLFPTEEETDRHRRTRRSPSNCCWPDSWLIIDPLQPSKCLHCGKIFGTEEVFRTPFLQLLLTLTRYELETHYEWHDDMELRNRIDNLQDRVHETDANKIDSNTPPIFDTMGYWFIPGDDELTEEIDLGQGLRMVPLPVGIGKSQESVVITELR